jgi:hypothetical protein
MVDSRHLSPKLAARSLERGGLLVIHDDRRLNASFSPVVVVIDHDRLAGAAIGKQDEVAPLTVSESHLRSSVDRAAASATAEQARTRM